MRNINKRNDSIKRNIFYNMCYQILILILPLITAPYISRVLGANNVGIYSYTQAIANYFVLFSMLGINNYGNRAIAKVRDNTEKLSKTFWEIYSFQVIMSIIMSITYLIYIYAYLDRYKGIYLLQYLYIISAIFDINWFCFGMEKFKITIIRNIVIKISSALAIFIFVRDINDLGNYTFIVSIGILLSQIAIWPYVLKEIYFIRPQIKGIISHIKPNLLLFIPVLSISLYNIMDKLMLGFFTDSIEVGYYDYAQKIVEVPNTLVLAIGTVMMPRISNLIANGKGEKSDKLIKKSILGAMTFSTAFSFGLAAIAPIFTPWFYGDEFKRCGIFIVCLSPIIVFKGCAGIIRTQLIIPNEKDKVYILSISAGAVVNFVVNYFLIPKYQGMGAVIGTILAEATVCIIQFVKMRRYINIVYYIKLEFMLCIFGFIMYFIINKISYVNLGTLITILIQIVFGIIIYGGLIALYFLKNKKKI